MSPNTPLPRDTRRFNSESGSILILTALAMVCLLGVVALAVDGSFMYTERNRMGMAADEAAKSAAFEVFHLSTTSQGNIEGHADHEVLAHGFNPTRLGGDTTVEVNRPPLTGLHTSESTYVEVYVSRPTSTFFGRILGWASLTPKVRAVAGQSSSQSCVQTLAPPGHIPASLSIGNTDLIMPNCNVQVGGNIEGTNNNATITSGGLSVSASSCTGTANQCDGFGGVAYNAPPPYDQFAGQIAPVPSPLTGCTPAPSTGTIGGGGLCYSSLAIGNNGTVTLSAGVTYLTGPITFGNNATLAGTDVTLVLADGSSITTGNSSSVTLIAPVTGTYPGIAIYQPASNPNPMNFQNHPVFNVNGAVYAPTSDVSFRNGYDSTSDCVLMVVYSLNIDNGNGQFNNACARYSGSPLMTVSLAE